MEQFRHFDLGVDMAERALADKSERGGSRIAAVVMVSILAVAGLGFGLATIVDALEPEGCGPYGYGGYGCEPIGDATIAVTPSTDLVDRQTVTVTGEGFGPSTSFGAAQCDPSVGPNAGTDVCDLSTATITTTDSSGHVQLTMDVRRIITVQGRDVDCALEPCTVGAATLSGGTTPIEAASAPISFDPNVPAIPRLTIELTVEDATASAMTGTATCNREAEAFVEAALTQEKGGSIAFAFGFSDDPIACSTTPTEWTVELSSGSGRFTGGKAEFEAYGAAYDGYDSVSTLVTGEVHVSGGPALALPPGENPGETVRVQIVGTSRSDDGWVVDVIVTCDRAVPEGSVFVGLTQLAGLAQVEGYGFVDLGPCDGVREVAVPITSFTGKLAGGPATVEAFVEIYDLTTPDEFFDFASARTSVRLRGSGPVTAFEVVPNPTRASRSRGRRAARSTGTITCEEPVDVELSTLVQQSKGRTTPPRTGTARSRATDPPPSRSSSTGSSVAGVHPPSSTPRPSRRRRAGTSSSGMTCRPPRSTSGADGPSRQARARRAGPLIAVALAAVAGGWAVVGSAWVLPELSANSDEGLYLLQAETLASGRLAPEAPAVDAASYRPWFSAERDGRYVLKYAPVHASVLAAADVATGSQRPRWAPSRPPRWRSSSRSRGSWEPAAGRHCSPARSSPSRRSRCSSTSPTCPYGTSLALLLAAATLHRACVAHGITPRRRRRRALLGAGRLRAALRRRPDGRGDHDGRRRGAGPPESRCVAARGVPWQVWPPSGRSVRCWRSLAFNHAMTGDALQLPFRILEPRDGPGLGLRRSLPTDRYVDYTFHRAVSSFGRNLLLVSAWGAGGLLGACLAVATLVRRRLRGRAADRRRPRRLVRGLRALLGLLRRRVPLGRRPVPGTLLLPPDGGDAGDPGRRRAG